ncbi:MAG: FAD-dependent oxidoreductase [Pseudomonadota bacterium]
MTRFPITDQSPIVYSPPLPAASDVVVIGGGVIGVTTAVYLAQAGHRVSLLEKGRIAGEQSARNWGWIRQQGRDPAELPIMKEANHLWRDFARQTNVDFGLRQGGTLYIARSPRELRSFEAWLPHAVACDVDSQVLSRREVKRRFPDLTDPVTGALYTASDLRAEPWLAVPALAEIAVRAGVTIIENCAVRALDISAGRVSGVVTERGVIKTTSVVLAAGAWSALFLRNHDISIPQLAVRETVAATTPLPEITPSAFADPHVSIRRRLDGGYTLAPSSIAELFIGPDAFRALPKYLPQLWAAPFNQTYLPAAPTGFPDGWRTPRRWDADAQTPFERMRILNPKPNRGQIKRAARTLAKTFPRLPRFHLRATWAGMIDTMPDVVPIVDHCAHLPGLIIGTGMSGHGFGIGPGMGRILAALVRGDTVSHDLTRFRFSRFSDGSPIQL